MPVQPTAGPVGRSEALLVTSVLAEFCGPLASITSLPETYGREVVHRLLVRYGHDHALAWMDRVPAVQWRSRWRIAMQVAARLYPTLPGVRQLPQAHPTPPVRQPLARR